MILRRLTESLRKQDWFTVVLEVLVVVTGIFIGLQVDDWNEARKDRTREIEYLERIDRALVSDIAEIENAIRLAIIRGELTDLVIASVENPEIVAGDPEAFIIALVRGGWSYAPNINFHTFEEIKSAGEMGIIRDLDLRSAITGYYQEVSQYGQWNFLRELKQTEYLRRQAGILTVAQLRGIGTNNNDYEVTAGEAMAIHARLLARPAFIEWLPLIADRDSDIGNYEGELELARELRAQIAETLGNGRMDEEPHQ